MNKTIYLMVLLITIILFSMACSESGNLSNLNKDKTENISSVNQNINEDKPQTPYEIDETESIEGKLYISLDKIQKKLVAKRYTLIMYFEGREVLKLTKLPESVSTPTLKDFYKGTVLIDDVPFKNVQGYYLIEYDYYVNKILKFTK